MRNGFTGRRTPGAGAAEAAALGQGAALGDAGGGVTDGTEMGVAVGVAARGGTAAAGDVTGGITGGHAIRAAGVNGGSDAPRVGAGVAGVAIRGVDGGVGTRGVAGGVGTRGVASGVATRGTDGGVGMRVVGGGLGRRICSAPDAGVLRGIADGTNGAGGGLDVKAVPTRSRDAAAGAGAGAGASANAGAMPTGITPLQVEQRARTPPFGTLAGSTR